LVLGVGLFLLIQHLLLEPLLLLANVDQLGGVVRLEQ
jgi:hypothetical protein